MRTITYPVRNGVPVIALIALTMLTGCPLFPREETENISALVKPPAEEEIVTHTVKEGPIADEVDITTRVGSAHEKTLFFSVPGCVREIMVKNGDIVAKGKVLATLDTGDLDSDVEQAKLRLDQELINLDLQTQLNRREYDQETNAMKQQIAELGLRRARLEYDRLQKRLDRAVIRAPFGGRVINVRINRGKTVEAYAPAMTVTGTADLVLIAEVEFAKAVRFNEGMRARIELGDGKNLTGRVTLIEKPEVVLSNPDNYYVYVRPDNQRHAIRMDEYYTTYLVIRSEKRALIVPNDAVREDVNSRKYLRVIEGKKRRDVYIRTGIINGTMTQITEGAAAGMTVIGK